MKHFGEAGLPLFQFDVKLRFGYYATVAVWETRRLMSVAAECPCDTKKETLHGVCDYVPAKGKLLSVMHLSLPSLSDGLIAHETYHLIRHLERKVSSRLKNTDAREEMGAREMERTYLAIRSHIAEERRLLG